MRLLSLCLALCAALCLCGAAHACPPAVSLGAYSCAPAAPSLSLSASYVAAPVTVLRVNTGAYGYGAFGVGVHAVGLNRGLFLNRRVAVRGNRVVVRRGGGLVNLNIGRFGR